MEHWIVSNLNLTTALILTAVMGAFIGAIIASLVAAYRYNWRHIGKSWVLIVPETVGTELTVVRTKLLDGKFDVPSRNHDAIRGDQDRQLPQGNVAYQARGEIRGPLHIMSAYGANLVAPTKLQAAEHIEKIAVADWLKDYKRQPKKEEIGKDKDGKDLPFTAHLEAAWAKAKEYATLFLIWDPLAYFKACDENDMQDFLNSQGGVKDPWYAKAAFVGVIFLGGLMLLMLGIIGLKVLPAIQAANAGP
jgi:hypothetical protein